VVLPSTPRNPWLAVNVGLPFGTRVKLVPQMLSSAVD